jgi:SHS2 domain-containing protein
MVEHLEKSAQMAREEELKYRYIEHPSDVGFEAYGATLEELFANAATAMYSFMTDIDEIETTETKEITVNAEDLYSLMFDWLDEMLFLFESESLVMNKFDITIDDSMFRIKGTCSGGKFDPAKHESGIIIKAVTYNMMEIKKNEVWHAQVVLDV